MQTLLNLGRKHSSLAYSFMPVALWSATVQISNDRTPEGTKGPGDLQS